MVPLEATWPDRVITAQRNWIGRSEGAHVRVRRRQAADEPTLTVYTTRPDTLFGATFMVVAADAALAGELVTDEQRPAYEAYLEETRKASEIDRMSTDRPKTGVFLGVHATNPVTGEQIPVWAADYVLADYGTGAIMAVPGQDQRDWDFATKFDLPIVRTVQPPEGWEGEAYVGQGPAVNSVRTTTSRWTAWRSTRRSARSSTWLEEKGAGEGTVNFRLRDWLLSRQRYWGVPIPIVHCETTARSPVPYDQLPLELPELKGADLKPKGVSPLAAAEDWVNVDCPTVRRPGQARQRHDGHVRGLVVVLPALLLADDYTDGPFDEELVRRVDAGRHLHRWRRARGAAPAVRALLHQGAARHGDGRLRRAVLRPAEPGLRDQPRQEDEQVAGQRRQSGGPTCGVRSGRRPPDPGLRRAARGRHRLGRDVAGRVAALPEAGLAAER